MIRLSGLIVFGVLLLTGCAPLPQTILEIAFARLNKGLDFYMAGRYDLALSEAGAAIRLAPDPILVAYALNVRAAAYLKIGRYEQALEGANASIRADATIATAYINRDNVYLALKEWQAAAADFAVAISPDKHFYPAYVGLAKANVGLNSLELALEDYRAALALAPDQSAVAQIKNSIKVLEQRAQAQSASLGAATPSTLCIWFHRSQILRGERISALAKSMTFAQQVSTEGFSLLKPPVLSQLRIALETYLPDERKFLTAWEELGSTPGAEDYWAHELLAVQQTLAADEKMLKGLEVGDNGLFVTGSKEFEQARSTSSDAMAAMQMLKEQCQDALK